MLVELDSSSLFSSTSQTTSQNVKGKMTYIKLGLHNGTCDVDGQARSYFSGNPESVI